MIFSGFDLAFHFAPVHQAGERVGHLGFLKAPLHRAKLVVHAHHQRLRLMAHAFDAAQQARHLQRDHFLKMFGIGGIVGGFHLRGELAQPRGVEILALGERCGRSLPESR